jgi:hypothetical protein
MPKHPEIVGGFFSAIQSFISAILFENCDKPEKVNRIEIGSYEIQMFPILVQHDVDLILFHDKIRNKEEKKEIQCLAAKIASIFIENYDKFIDWDGDYVGEFFALKDTLIDTVKGWLEVYYPEELQGIIV